MKVLIVENELYLAQSMSNKLGDAGYQCDIAASVSQVENKHYEVILLSSAVSDFLKFAEKRRNSIIILLVSYISVDTVVTPLKLGVSDYIQKPFMIEELLRKIKHHQYFRALEQSNQSYLAYINSKLSEAKISHFDYKKIKLPLILKTRKQINADFFAFHYAKAHELFLNYINLENISNLDNLFQRYKENNLYFLDKFQSLKTEDQQRVLLESKKRNVLIFSDEKIEHADIHTLELSHDDKNPKEKNEILTIDEYVKFIIVNYQSVFPDTDLSKKLGISRKSLWEKRKKYGLTKKK
ncbi:hypothetical protein DMB92_04685 [Campylobacter sp. MIT 99-7217]|uniref:response regulator n=1 Tax=Campylobacter sp. MIT 99-7217 TaxID=535091 RepID=UPI00115BDE95|nr:response regulator [Campylobacter sp. MIT 99-7217]TQR32397.1 hypothetical protein DMB92_04685 [Campylobacter sp. MIT 99-7217]